MSSLTPFRAYTETLLLSHFIFLFFLFFSLANGRSVQKSGASKTAYSKQASKKEKWNVYQTLSAVNFLDDGIKDLNAKGRATSQLNH
jgi:hypothetical protein